MRELHLKLYSLLVLILAAATFPASSQTTLISATNSVWKFYTNSAGYNVNPGYDANWKLNDFDDSSWPTGVGLFGLDTGYGYGFNTVIPGPSSGGPITVYYRIHFNWASSPTGVILTGTNYVDDGDVIYLNGMEITRFTMSPGDPVWETLAPATVTEPIKIPMSISLDSLTNGNANPLVMGDNVLSVEVHNQAATSSDHVFGLWLFASQQICPTTDGTQPTNRTALENSSTTLIVNGSGVPSPTFQWYRNVGAGDEAIPGATGPRLIDHEYDHGPGRGIFCPTAEQLRHDGGQPSRDRELPGGHERSHFGGAQCGTGADDIIVLLSEPLLVDNGMGNTLDDTFTWQIEKVTGPGTDPGFPALVTYTPGSTTILMTAPAGSMNPLATYRVVLQFDMFDLAATPNKLPAGTAVAIECPQAISVLPTGAGPFTFSSPPFAKEFSTFTWAGAANGTVDTIATFEPKVQLLDASTITTPLASAAGTPPAAAGMAQYASEGHYLITRPTGVEGAVILAHLRNDSGQTRTALDISYNLNVEIPVVEELLGHYVYYSLTGAPSTWLPVPGISGDGTIGLKTGHIDLSATPWTVGSTLYVLWADDNGSGSPDNANEIDNVSFSIPVSGPTLSITYASPNITITWNPAVGILQFKDDITGTWADVNPQPAAGGPYTVPASAAHRYYSLRQ